MKTEATGRVNVILKALIQQELVAVRNVTRFTHTEKCLQFPNQQFH
jgi:hypothetical protein